MTDLEKAEGQFLDDLEEYVRSRILFSDEKMTDNRKGILSLKLHHVKIGARRYGNECALKMFSKQRAKQETKDAAD